MDSRRTKTRQAGKVLSFLGVMLLVLGLLGGDAGASGQGKGKGTEDAPGQLKKHDAGALAGASSASQEDCGSYCSTSDGTPSANGNGDGDANGKPCAGCVGNADNKNPPGQYKDGSDHNNGYECDGNNGVAKGNPAHSACQPAQPGPTTTTTVAPTTTTTVAPTTTTAPPQQTTTTVAVGGTTTPPPADVLGVQFSRGTETPRGLASTGAGFMRPFTLLGALFLLMGMALMIIRVRPLAQA